MYARIRRDAARYSSAPRRRAVRAADLMLCHPGFVATLIYRVQQALTGAAVPVMPWLLRWLNLAVFGCDIVPGAQIGGGLFMPHPQGVVIGAGASTGDSCTILQQVTLGERISGRNRGMRYPHVGDHVLLGAGAKLIGPINIGHHARIGAGAVVNSDIPAGSVCVGVPGRVVGSPRP